MVKVRSQSSRIDGGQSSPALNQYRGWNRTASERAQFGDRLPVAGHGERFASCDTIENVTPAVPKFPDRNLTRSHSFFVSPVRHQNKARIACQPRG